MEKLKRKKMYIMVNHSKAKDYDKKAVFKFAGAFIAWVIGSGFATGQETLQFFTSFGKMSYAVLILNLIGFTFFAQYLLVTGYENKDNLPFSIFKHFCGKKLGSLYSGLIVITLLLIMPVLIAGAGATLNEYYGINKYIGSAVMTVMVLAAYLIGFEKLVKVVSKLGPIIILFSLAVGIITVFRDIDNFSNIERYESLLSETRAAPNWFLSGILYLSLNFLSGGAYFAQLGITANSRKEAKYGALLGSSAIILTVLIMNTAMLLNAEEAAPLAIPVLYLAKKISYLFGAVFSIILILGMFSSCSAMMWSVCNGFNIGGARGNKLFAVLIAIFIFILGLFSFTELVGTFYPLVGYLGLVYMGCILYKRIKK